MNNDFDQDVCLTQSPKKNLTPHNQCFETLGCLFDKIQSS